MISNLEIHLQILFYTPPEQLFSIPSNTSLPAAEAPSNLYGISTCKFNLKEVSQDRPILMDYCGDKIFGLTVNGTDYPHEQISWTNNQIKLPGLRRGTFQLIRR